MYSLRYDNDSLCGKNTQVKYTTPYTRKHWLMMLMADHISAVCRSSYYHLRQLRCVVQSQTSDVAKTLVQRFVSCRLDYCNSLLYGVADGQVHRLQSDRNAAARLVTGTRWSEHISLILKSLHWLPIRQRITFKLATLVKNCMNGRVPVYLADDRQLVSRRQTRSATAAFLDVPRTSTSLSSRMFSVAGPRTRNSVSITIRTSSLF